MKLFKPLQQWSIDDVTRIGWLVVACTALAIRIVPGGAPGITLGMIVGAWCVVGLAKIGHKIVHRELPLWKLVGVAAAWPLALHSDAFNE